jgi:hypothetical protein
MGRDRLEPILAQASKAWRLAEEYTTRVDEVLASVGNAYGDIGARLSDDARVLARVLRDAEAAIERQKRRRKRFEDALTRDSRCKRKGCNGRLEIKDETSGDMVVWSSLVCTICNYNKLDSPEYAHCYLADSYLEAAKKLAGTPPLPASFSAYWACELYLRELGGSYYYRSDGDDDSSVFVSPSNQHSLLALRGTLEKSRRDRLDIRQVDRETFKELLFKLPEGIWRLLRYGEDGALRFSGEPKATTPSVDAEGRLFINGVDVYAVLVEMGTLMKGFVGEEFRRNLG